MKWLTLNWWKRKQTLKKIFMKDALISARLWVKAWTFIICNRSDGTYSWSWSCQKSAAICMRGANTDSFGLSFHSPFTKANGVSSSHYTVSVCQSWQLTTRSGTNRPSSRLRSHFVSTLWSHLFSGLFWLQKLFLTLKRLTISLFISWQLITLVQSLFLLWTYTTQISFSSNGIRNTASLPASSTPSWTGSVLIVLAMHSTQLLTGRTFQRLSSSLPCRLFSSLGWTTKSRPIFKRKEVSLKNDCKFIFL